MKKYMPVLKSKEGELKALKNLKTETHDLISPMLNIHDVPYDWIKGKDKKTLSAHLKDVGDNIKEYCSEPHSYFIDFGFVRSEDCNGLHYADFFFKHLRSLQVKFYPVTGLDRIGDNAFQETIRACLVDGKSELGIRLDREDLELISFQNEALEELVQYFNIDKNRIHLFLDLKHVQPDEVDELVQSIAEAYRQTSEFEGYASTTIISGAMPETLGGQKKDTIAKQHRTDYILWKKCVDSVNKNINFGDYGVVNPSVLEIDPRKMNRSGRIRYTDKDSWHIFKGQSQKKKKPREQNPELARKVIKHSAYLGRDFSWGDEYILKCSKGEVVGSATNWVTADMSHHIEYVAKQVSK